MQEEMARTWKKYDEVNNVLNEFKQEHLIMKQLLIEHNLWETLLNDDRFLNYLRDDELKESDKS